MFLFCISIFSVVSVESKFSNFLKLVLLSALSFDLKNTSGLRFIPFFNAISIIALIIIGLILIGDSYNNSFEKAFGETSKLNKFIKFLNKKI